MLTNRSQRWRLRRSIFVPNATEIDPRDYAVDALDHAAARAFIGQHHYLQSYPAAQFAAGLYRKAQLVGAAVFATPSNDAVITAHTGLENPRNGTTLARLILLDVIPGNAETFFVARARKLLRIHKPEIEAFVSYADETAGHIGQVYAALSGSYRGRTRSRRRHFIGDVQIAERTLCKIALEEPGGEGAARQILTAGADGRRPFEPPAQWIDRLRQTHQLVSHPVPGLHIYSFPLTMAARLAERALPRHPYPRLHSLPE